MELHGGFSVLMPVHNKIRSEWFINAFQSIYHRQTVKPSEIVIVFDGPVPKPIVEAVDAFREELPDVVKVVALPYNSGVANALNAGLQECTYEWIARMDADDESLPYRFERQLSVVRNDPEVCVVGGQIQEYDEDMKNPTGVRKVPVTHPEIYSFARKRCPVNHMTAMFRKSAVLEVGGYPILPVGQDYALWTLLLSKGYRFYNLPDVLVKVRAGNVLISKRSGLKYAYCELQLALYLLNTGFWNYVDFIRYGIPRIAIRLMPKSIVELVYTHFRSKV